MQVKIGGGGGKYSCGREVADCRWVTENNVFSLLLTQVYFVPFV
jgi:hypothetical protein